MSDSNIIKLIKAVALVYAIFIFYETYQDINSLLKAPSALFSDRLYFVAIKFLAFASGGSVLLNVAQHINHSNERNNIIGIHNDLVGHLKDVRRSLNEVSRQRDNAVQHLEGVLARNVKKLKTNNEKIIKSLITSFVKKYKIRTNKAGDVTSSYFQDFSRDILDIKIDKFRDFCHDLLIISSVFSYFNKNKINAIEGFENSPGLFQDFIATFGKIYGQDERGARIEIMKDVCKEIVEGFKDDLEKYTCPVSFGVVEDLSAIRQGSDYLHFYDLTFLQESLASTASHNQGKMRSPSTNEEVEIAEIQSLGSDEHIKHHGFLGSIMCSQSIVNFMKDHQMNEELKKFLPCLQESYESLNDGFGQEWAKVNVEEELIKLENDKPLAQRLTDDYLPSVDVEAEFSSLLRQRRVQEREQAN